MAKVNKEIQRLITSKKQEDISKGLEMFEKKGSILELPYVLDLLNSDVADLFEKQIIELVGNIKVKASSSIIIDQVLKVKEEQGNLRALMQICWQSSLDFTQNLALFTEIFVESDYLTALEAFTIIENIWGDYAYEEHHQQLLIDTIKDELGSMDENKFMLAKELILVLES